MYSMGKKTGYISGVVLTSACQIRVMIFDVTAKKHEWEIYMIDIYWNDYAGGFYDTCIRMHKSREEKTFLKVLIEVCIIIFVSVFCAIK